MMTPIPSSLPLILVPKSRTPPSPSKTSERSSASRSADTNDGTEREPRGARRKRETREKLLDAAFRLMAARGMDAVAINEITEAADVGFGSFYNHFDSKEAIYAAVMDAVFEDFADALDHLVRGVGDSAEIVSICVRHVILRARREPLWGRFLLREGFSADALSKGLGARLMRDMQKGVIDGRFRLPDPVMSFIAAGSSVLGAISAELEKPGFSGSLPNMPVVDTQNIPERAAALLLHHFGVPFDEAQRIAQRPLPAVDRPPT